MPGFRSYSSCSPVYSKVFLKACDELGPGSTKTLKTNKVLSVKEFFFCLEETVENKETSETQLQKLIDAMQKEHKACKTKSLAIASYIFGEPNTK